jgi:hypothetical protein
MIKNIIIAFLTILYALAFTFAAYQKSEAEIQREEAKKQAQLANKLRFQLDKMEWKFDSLNNTQANEAKANQH